MAEEYKRYIEFLKDNLGEDFDMIKNHTEEVERAITESGEVTIEFIYNIADMMEALIDKLSDNIEEKIVDDDSLVELEEGEIDDLDVLEEEDKVTLSLEDTIEEGFDKILQYIKDGELYNHNNEYQKRGFMLIKKEEETYKLGVKGTRGITTCGVCKMDNIIIYSAQKRGADEGETIFNTCVDCGNKWVIR